MCVRYPTYFQCTAALKDSTFEIMGRYCCKTNLKQMLVGSEPFQTDLQQKIQTHTNELQPRMQNKQVLSHPLS
jgi:hypothetical protein